MLEEGNKKLYGGAAWPGHCVHARNHSLSLVRELSELNVVAAVSLRRVQNKLIALLLTVLSYKVGKDNQMKALKTAEENNYIQKCNFLEYEGLLKKKINQTTNTKPNQQTKPPTINKQLMSTTNRSLTVANFHFRRMVESCFMGSFRMEQFLVKCENISIAWELWKSATFLSTISNGDNVSRETYLHFSFHFMTLPVHLLYVRQEPMFCQNYVSVQYSENSWAILFPARNLVPDSQNFFVSSVD